jgi:hypothetical protein
VLSSCGPRNLRKMKRKITDMVATDSEVNESTIGDGDDSEDEYFGPEDDGGAVDPNMEALGYADL